MKVALFPIGWSLRTNEWFQSVSLIFVFFFSDPMCVRLKRLSVLTTTQRWNSFVLSLTLLSLSQKVFLLIKRVFQTRGDDANTKRISRALVEHFFVFAFVLETRVESVLVRARIFARCSMMIFSFFWGKNSRCGLKKTLETLWGLLRASRKKGLYMCENAWCDLFLSLSLSLSLERERSEEERS